MLRPSKLADYATVVMTGLARDPERLRNAADLAADTHLSVPTVSKVLKRLAREGLLVSIRGAHGGYRLARPPADITMAQIIAALEGPLGLTDCAAHNGRCGIESLCQVRGNWLRINHAVQRALDGVTLAEMAEPFPPPPRTEVPLRRAQARGT
ncbi:MAG TPA: SUF system Fe-S cluster assembly regulator [Nevskiales bacterium]|nr:SUF system Fe-S cluster assembly regulator [Nevskiales bacterium]